MIRAVRAVMAMMLVVGVTACGDSKFKTYDGPPITQVQVDKSKRRMYMISGDKVVKKYKVSLGNQPQGHKQFEGDGRTPEGVYFIDRTNPNSRYHLSVGISYPNVQDVARAAAVGRSAGSDIFIHGRGPEGNSLIQRRKDWTAGCIAVSDDEIEDIYAMLRPGTPVVINP